MTASWRFSTLADRHRALGSKLEDWSGMGTAWTYDKDADEEYIAIRTKAGLMDVSGLKKVHITGPHASHLIDLATTRDVEKIYPGKSAYACMLNEAGKFTDDCILYRTGPNSWMVVHGSGTGHEELQRAAIGRDVSLRFDDNLHDLSLQGPTGGRLSRQARAGHPRPQLFPSHADAAVRLAGDDLAHRLHRRARLRDLLPRPGCRHDLGHDPRRGQERRASFPCRFTTLDMLRVESYLLFYPYDNSQKYPFDERRPRRHAVGARPRLHRQPRQDRLPRRRGALPAEGQGALQDLSAFCSTARSRPTRARRSIATARRSAW